jgi:hypothetical protein
MDGLITLLALAAIAVALYLLFVRGNEIFFVSIRSGRAMLVRGRIPPNLLTQIGDVARRSGIARGDVKAYRGEQRARIATSGIGQDDAQRLRNLFSLHPIHALRSAPVRKPENFGQVLGIAWLAWALTSSRRG